MTNYILREESQVFSIEDENYANRKLSDFLQENYPYIYNSLKDENFDIDSYDQEIFAEIVHDSEVVGFSLFKVLNEMNIALSFIYVLPDFRGKGLATRELRLFYNSFNVSIYYPTHKFMEFLYYHDFADYFNDDILISLFDLVMDSKDMECLTNNDFEDKDDYISSPTYSTQFSGILYFKNLDKNFIVYISKALEEDNKYYECLNQRKEVTIEYIDYMTNNLINYTDIFNGLRESVIDYNNHCTQLENIIDPVTKDFTGEYKEIIESYNLSDNKLNMIKERLSFDYNTDNVDSENLLTRLFYLCEYIDNPKQGEIDNSKFKKIDEETYEDQHGNIYNECSYCGNLICIDDGFCDICGYTNKDYSSLDTITKAFVEDVDEFDLITEFYIKTMDNFDELDNLLESMEKDKENISEESLEAINKIIPDFYRLDYIPELDHDEILFDVLNSEDNMSFEKQSMLVSILHPIKLDILYPYLKEKDYITDSLNEDNFNYYLSKLNVKQLRKILQQNNLKSTGNKKKLVRRISEKIKPEKIHIAEEYLTAKSIEFIENYDEEEYDNFDFDDDFL